MNKKKQEIYGNERINILPKVDPAFIVKGFGNCISMLMAHDTYDPNKTGKEMLENDNFF